jgi:hypothetical protein
MDESKEDTSRKITRLPKKKKNQKNIKHFTTLRKKVPGYIK